MKYEKESLGLLIEQRMNELGISKSELARRIGIPPQNINRLLEKESLDTDRLISIGEALDYDFFAHFRPVVAETGAQGDAVGGHQVKTTGDNSPTSLTGNITLSAPAAPCVDTAKEVELARLKERVKALEAAIKDKEAAIADRESRIKDKDQHIADLKDTIALLREKR